MTIYHDFKSPTECCKRPADELPLGDGRTSSATHVTCDGTFTPAVHAHELYPHPSDRHDEPQTLVDAVRYHLARTLAMCPPEHLSDDGGLDRAWMDRINLMLTERTVACLVVALHKGMSGQRALDWAHVHSSGETGELIYDLAREYGVEVDRIRHYSLREEPGTEPAPAVQAHAYRAEVLSNAGTDRERWVQAIMGEDRETLEGAAADAADLIGTGYRAEHVRVAAVTSVPVEASDA